MSLLIKNGAQVDSISKNGYTPLHIAVDVRGKRGFGTPQPQTQNSEIIKSLIDAGANLDKKANDGRTSLMIAAQRDNHSAITLLVGMGADRTLQDNRGKTVYDYADKHERALLRTQAEIESLERRFSKPGDATFTDATTGLQWAMRPIGEAKWTELRDACAALSLAGHTDWRMPTKTEMQSLINEHSDFYITGIDDEVHRFLTSDVIDKNYVWGWDTSRAQMKDCGAWYSTSHVLPVRKN